MTDADLDSILAQIAYRCTRSRMRPDEREREFFLCGMLEAAELHLHNPDDQSAKELACTIRETVRDFYPS